MNRANPLLVGIIAGLAAAIFMAAAGSVPFLSMLLLSATLTSIFIAGLGWGVFASLIAIATAAAASAALYQSPESLFFVSIPMLPAAAMAYVAGLARPADEIGGPEAAIAWFPLSDILLIGAVLTAIATIVVLGLHPEMEELYRRVAEAARQMMAEMSPEAPIQTFSDEAMLAFLRVLWPIVQSAQMMIALFAGYYFASRILSAAGRGTRPREDIPSSLRMNRLAIAVLLAGIALMFAGTAATAIGASFAGAVAAGFLMSGFAIIHNMVRGKSWALPVLVLVYLLTMIMPLIGLALILAGGLANPRRAIALTPTKPNPDSNEPT